MYQRVHFSRYAMYRSIENWCSTHPCSGNGKTVGGVSKITELYPSVNWEVTDLTTGVNVECLPWGDGSIDILVADQMLEHVPRPWIARDEMLRVLKPGGILIVTTCFLQIHHTEHLYFTFHMEGLSSLFNQYLTDVVCEGWGNRIANDLINYSDTRWAKVQGALQYLVDTSDPKAPFCTWIMGRKK